MIRTKRLTTRGCWKLAVLWSLLRANRGFSILKDWLVAAVIRTKRLTTRDCWKLAVLRSLLRANRAFSILKDWLASAVIRTRKLTTRGCWMLAVLRSLLKGRANGFIILKEWLDYHLGCSTKRRSKLPFKD